MVIQGKEIFLETLLLYYGIGRSTLFLWQKQDKENGLPGLINKSTAPRHSLKQNSFMDRKDSAQNL